MAKVINLTTLHYVVDGVDLGHVVDAARNDAAVAADAKAALDLAWIDKQEATNVKARELDMKVILLEQAAATTGTQAAAITQANAIIAARDAAIEQAASEKAAAEEIIAAKDALLSTKDETIAAKDAALVDALQEIITLKDAALVKAEGELAAGEVTP